MKGEQMDYKFLSNIIDPDHPDAMNKLLSENYGDRGNRRSGTVEQYDDDGHVMVGKVSKPLSPEKVLSYVKHIFLVDKILGRPVPPAGSSLTEEDLINMGYRGVYVPVYPSHRLASPGCGTGTGVDRYPKRARYAENGDVLEVFHGEIDT